MKQVLFFIFCIGLFSLSSCNYYKWERKRYHNEDSSKNWYEYHKKEDTQKEVARATPMNRSAPAVKRPMPPVRTPKPAVSEPKPVAKKPAQRVKKPVPVVRRDKVERDKRERGYELIELKKKDKKGKKAKKRAKKKKRVGLTEEQIRNEYYRKEPK